MSHTYETQKICWFLADVQIISVSLFELPNYSKVAKIARAFLSKCSELLASQYVPGSLGIKIRNWLFFWSRDSFNSTIFGAHRNGIIWELRNSTNFSVKPFVSVKNCSIAYKNGIYRSIFKSHKSRIVIFKESLYYFCRITILQKRIVNEGLG